MFQWDKSIKCMGVPVTEVVNLYRSMRDVQLALPGLPAQEATAYLCQHRTAQGIGTIAAFHLHKSSQLAFYVDSPVLVAAGKADGILDQALMFVESMGFLMSDLDIHLLSKADRELLWSSLPLQNGLQEKEKSAPPKSAQTPPTSVEPKSAAPSPVVASETVSASARTSVSSSTEMPRPDVRAGELRKQAVTGGEPIPEGRTDVDDLLAAVEELRTRRPGIRSRKRPPSPEELDRRRRELRENLGRILASL